MQHLFRSNFGLQKKYFESLQHVFIENNSLFCKNLNLKYAFLYLKFGLITGILFWFKEIGGKAALKILVKLTKYFQQKLKFFFPDIFPT
jgi:hypothetical protein